MESGIYVFEDSNVVFMDPVRVLNRSYNHFRVSPSTYYTRFFESKTLDQDLSLSSTSRKRKRNVKEPRALNERERIADNRHRVLFFQCRYGSQ